jgi:coiled-coil and C2 domain-containing protein 2A
MIPYIDDSKLFKDMPDLTCNSQEFLDLGMGDSEEHAILLANYFNFIDKAAKRQQLNE